MRVISQTNLESAVRLLQKETSDLVVVFLPDETDSDEEEGDQRPHDARADRRARAALPDRPRIDA